MSALIPFGFSALESDVYVFLAQNPGASGYRVAQGLGKPAANVYKAIQTLAAKGAVELEDGEEPRRAIPVPPKELIRRLEREMNQTLTRLRDEIGDVPPSAPGPTLSHLPHGPAVRERALAMAESAERSVVGSLDRELGSEIEIEAGVLPRLVTGPLLLVVDESRALVSDGGSGAYVVADPALVSALHDAALARIARSAADDGASGKTLTQILNGDAKRKGRA